MSVRDVSVLFSEPKIPQFYASVLFRLSQSKFQCSSASRKFLNLSRKKRWLEQSVVSVLFSEPKIPQYKLVEGAIRTADGFSALQRAENSSILKNDKW